MGKLREFDIRFEHHQGVFSAGQMLIGSVYVELSEPMKMRNIRLNIHGRSKVHWKKTKGSGDSRKTVHYRAEVLHINTTLVLWGSMDGEGCMHPSGQHTYNFEMQLAEDLPSSFEGDYGYVRYLCTATIDKPWKFDHDVKAAFTVLSLLDLNNEPTEIKSPMQGQHESEVSCCCCVEGNVHATFRINRRGFVPGEAIQIYAVITNNSNSSTNSSCVKLKQFSEFYGRSDSFFSSGTLKPKCESQCVAFLKREGIEAGGTDVWDNVPFQVPAIPPSRLDGCNIINLCYTLEFTVSVNYGPDISFSCDAVIGTVPLLDACAPQYDLVVSQQPSVQPTAPPPEPPPPSYEECVTGRIDITEEGDSQYTRGQLNWAPVYPMYSLPPPPAYHELSDANKV